ncbi:MAG: nucleotide sugar dehydrogenase [Elusimicrobia bacterium]|nr:nucleotide sugar dehydrogenase [Elusimicrobiota bacterium]
MASGDRHQSSQLLEKIKSREAVVGIIGLGYVGLPLAIRCADMGFPVLGFDIDEHKVKRLNSGQSYINHIGSDLIAKLVQQERLLATADFGRLGEADCILVCVPTPLTPYREPDLSYIVNTMAAIKATLRPGQFISLESTTYPGTTSEVLLTQFEKTGLKAGKDFYLVFSPERENPGNGKFALAQIPKVVGGVTSECQRVGRTFYEQIVERVVLVASPEAAEMTKLLENIFRCVNIALVNELKILCDRMGIDIWDVISAASTKPFGFMPFYPGPGLGGHCIPVDPFYLTWKAREYDMVTRFVELAGEINSGMPQYVVAKTVEALNKRGRSIKDAKVLVLGVSYKKDVGDIRESPALKVIELLMRYEARVAYSDPHIPSFGNLRHYQLTMESLPLSESLLREMDVVMIITDHGCFDYEQIVECSQLIIDTRNATSHVKAGREKIIKA